VVDQAALLNSLRPARASLALSVRAQVTDLANGWTSERNKMRQAGLIYR
jgi:hypothetical protein